jgi:hypothetical protein
MVYPAKRDWWITGLLLVPGCFLVADSIFLVGLVVSLNWSLVALLPSVCFLLIGLVLLWIAFGTAYELTAEELRIRFGPLLARIPLGAIVEVHATRGFGRSPGWGRALSFDRLLVRYRKADGRMAFGVKISPQNKAQFVRQLSAQVPGLKVFGDPA